MNFVVVSTAALVRKPDGLYGYAPYIREMEIWARHTGSVHFVCPVSEDAQGKLLMKLDFPVKRVYRLHQFDFLSVKGILRGLLFTPLNFLVVLTAMFCADHIHLRCPGNLSLLGCIAQLFLPWKKKTAKYAGNWDPAAQQPLSYRWQRSLLSNAFLTRNMQVMVYGQWPGSSANVRSFFTASYSEKDKTEIAVRYPEKEIRIIFVGTLSKNKNPLYAAALATRISEAGYSVSLEFYGDGEQRAELEQLTRTSNCTFTLKGNRDAAEVREAYGQSHFLILPSSSEGWPKVVAEAMFWGCIPLSTPVSCVPDMLGQGSRGILLTMDIGQDSGSVLSLLGSPDRYRLMASAAMEWSRKYTVERFDEEIRKLVE